MNAEISLSAFAGAWHFHLAADSRMKTHLISKISGLGLAPACQELGNPNKNTVFPLGNKAVSFLAKGTLQVQHRCLIIFYPSPFI